MKVIIISIISIAIIEVVAMFLGFNGQLLRWTIAAIVGLAGLATPAPKLIPLLKKIMKVI